MADRKEIRAEDLSVGQIFYPDGEKQQVISKIVISIKVVHTSPAEAGDPDIEPSTKVYSPDELVEVEG